MTRTKGLAAIALLLAAGLLGAVITQQIRGTGTPWTLQYTKPTGPFKNAEFKGISDPAPDKDVNIYVAEIASGCAVKRWTVEYYQMTDVNDTARVIIPKLTSTQEACLRSAVRPPYVTLERVAV